MMEKHAMTDRLLATLNGELGWNAIADDDGEIRFSSGMGFHVWVSSYAPRDPEYLQMHTGFDLAHFLEQAHSPLLLSHEGLQSRLLAGAARLTQKLKCAKVFVSPVDLTCLFSVEVVAAGPDRMPSIEHLAAILPRMRSMLINAVREFHDDVVLAGLEYASSTTWNSDAPGRSA